MNTIKDLNKERLHHAYLIEGDRENSLKEVLEFINNLGIETIANADVSQVSTDSFKIEDARNLKSLVLERGFSGGKRIFVISANNFLLEAQQGLLKVFEEPIQNTHFFVIIPDINSLLKTFVSRFYVISPDKDFKQVSVYNEAEKFLTMSLQSRIDFIKELLTEEENEGQDAGIVILDSNRSKALRFLNALEFTLHEKIISKTILNTTQVHFFEHFFKVREFLRMPGSSVKTLMESVALVTP